jgi:hypothetical protein
MDRIFFYLPFTCVYLDDLLIASQNMEDHRHQLREMLRRLQDNGLVLNVDKCQFTLPALEFLGHSVSTPGVAPLPSRVEAIRNFPLPAVVSELQAFLGLFNFYRRFVHKAAAIVKPLTDALRGSPVPTAAVKWSAEMVQAFAAARMALGNTALLEHPSAAADISLATDASATHIGAVLQQRRQGGAWKLLGFFSQKLSATEARYSTFDRELLAVHNSIVHFLNLREGRAFTIFTDHQPLIGALPGPRSQSLTASGGSYRSSPNFWPPFSMCPTLATWWLTRSHAPPLASSMLLNSGPPAGSTIGVAAAGLHLPMYTAVAASAHFVAPGTVMKAIADHNSPLLGRPRLLARLLVLPQRPFPRQAHRLASRRLTSEI